MKIIYEKTFQANIFSYMWKFHNAGNRNETKNIWRELNF